MIQFEKVSIGFDKAVLKDVTFKLPSGSMLGLIGPGGVGKSVLLKLCCGLLEPESGRISLGDVELTGQSEQKLAQVRQGVGMAFQNTALFDFMTVGENIAFPLRQQGGLADGEIETRVADSLTKVSLPSIANLSPSALSGGMKKRVALARAMIHRPPYVFCDDPTAGLDPVTSSRIFRMIDDIRRQYGSTCVVVSHDTEGLFKRCDFVGFLCDGSMAYFGPTQDAMTHKAVAEFILGKAAKL
ncbi:MAG: ATP-binding cassette domain-containing protein [Myxococcota bacterium]|nr:ATP-binding cassette domain-containing protein [Myxococcota bacterium]